MADLRSSFTSFLNTAKNAESVSEFTDALTSAKEILLYRNRELLRDTTVVGELAISLITEAFTTETAGDIPDVSLLEHLSFMSQSDPVKGIIALSSALSPILRCLARCRSSDPSVYARAVAVRDATLALVEVGLQPSTNTRQRLASTRLCEKFACATSAADQGNVSRTDAFSLSEISRDHTILDVTSLEAKGRAAVESLLEVYSSELRESVVSAVSKAAVNSLCGIVKLRPTRRALILDALLDDDSLSIAANSPAISQALVSNLVSVLKAQVSASTQINSSQEKVVSALRALKCSTIDVILDKQTKKRKREEQRSTADAARASKYPPTSNSIPTSGLHLLGEEVILNILLGNAENLPGSPPSEYTPTGVWNLTLLDDTIKKVLRGDISKMPVAPGEDAVVAAALGSDVSESINQSALSAFERMVRAQKPAKKSRTQEPSALAALVGRVAGSSEEFNNKLVTYASTSNDVDSLLCAWFCRSYGEDAHLDDSSSFTSVLTALANATETSVDARTALERLIKFAPTLPAATIEILRDLQGSNSSVSALRCLGNIVSTRCGDEISTHALETLLTKATDSDDRVRELSVRLLANKIFVARHLVKSRKIILEGALEQLQHIPSQPSHDAKRLAQLPLALCVRAPREVFPSLLDTFEKCDDDESSTEKRKILAAQSTKLFEFLAKKDELVSLCDEYPRGASHLVLHALETGCSSVGAEAMVKAGACEIRSADSHVAACAENALFLVPIVGGLSTRENVLVGLKRIFAIESDALAQKALKNISTGVIGRAWSVDDLMLSLIDDVTETTQIKRAIDALFALKSTFLTERILMAVLDGLCARPTLHILTMRIVIQSFKAFPKLKVFVLDLLAKLLRRSDAIENASIFAGAVACVGMLKPESFDLAVTLDAHVLRRVLKTAPALERPLRNFATAALAANVSAVSEEIQAVLGIGAAAEP